MGSRKCLGQHDAELLTKAFVVDVCSHYEMSVVGDESQHHGGEDIENGEDWIPPANVELKLERLKP
jgi:hypothetical protein